MACVQNAQRDPGAPRGPPAGVSGIFVWTVGVTFLEQKDSASLGARASLASAELQARLALASRLGGRELTARQKRA